MRAKAGRAEETHGFASLLFRLRDAFLGCDVTDWRGEGGVSGELR
jgi:hypothetical protein